MYLNNKIEKRKNRKLNNKKKIKLDLGRRINKYLDQ